MSDLSITNFHKSPDLRTRIFNWIARPGFQRWAAKTPFARTAARKDGEQIFDLVAGFVNSQVLAASLQTGLLDALSKGPRSLDALALALNADANRLRVLCGAAVSLDLIQTTRRGQYRLTRKGAVLLHVPGLADMIEHHSVLYQDLANPKAFFTAETETELARFWPYVFGAGAAKDPDTAQKYSNLMSDTQRIVAQDTLGTGVLTGVTHLLDVGGGQGAFLEAVSKAYSKTKLTLMDLPSVVENVVPFSNLLDVHGASFRDDPMPTGADAISLVRVLYDHSDDTVDALLAKVFAALPIGGRIIISEPMLTGSPATDAYFATYTLAMGTGKTRSPDEIMERLEKAGFSNAKRLKTHRDFVTSVVSATKDT